MTEWLKSPQLPLWSNQAEATHLKCVGCGFESRQRHMPYWGCSKCHHEWEGGSEDKVCDWCGGDGHVLEAETPLAKFLGDKDFIKHIVNHFGAKVPGSEDD